MSDNRNKTKNYNKPIIPSYKPLTRSQAKIHNTHNVTDLLNVDPFKPNRRLRKENEESSHPNEIEASSSQTEEITQKNEEPLIDFSPPKDINTDSKNSIEIISSDIDQDSKSSDHESEQSDKNSIKSQNSEQSNIDSIQTQSSTNFSNIELHTTLKMTNENQIATQATTPINNYYKEALKFKDVAQIIKPFNGKNQEVECFLADITRAIKILPADNIKNFINYIKLNKLTGDAIKLALDTEHENLEDFKIFIRSLYKPSENIYELQGKLAMIYQFDGENVYSYKLRITDCLF